MIFKNLISKNRGFTLIEMLVVLAVLAILLGLVSPNISLIAERANQAVGNLNAKIFRGNAVYDLALNNKSNIRISETVDLSTVGEVDDVVVNYSGTDTLKMLVSTDRGNSWHSYTINDQASLKNMFGGYAKAVNLRWELVDHSTPDVITDNALSIDDFNSLTKAEWLEILQNADVVTFAFNATDSEGNDITWDINPELSIVVTGADGSESVVFPENTGDTGTGNEDSGTDGDNTGDTGGETGTGDPVDITLPADSTNLFADNTHKDNGDHVDNYDLVNAVTDSATNLSGMFDFADEFNQDISGWNTSNVTDFSNLFYGAGSFNQNLGGWDFSSATNVNGIATNSGLDQSNYNALVDAIHSTNTQGWTVTDITGNIGTPLNGVGYTGTANDYISEEDASIVFGENINRMFQADQHKYNGDHVDNYDLANAYTSNVTSMNNIFEFTDDFNQDIGSWDTSNVQLMGGAFSHAANFNQDIGDWNTGKVELMSGMFANAHQFNQDISDWDFSSVTDMVNVIEDTSMSKDNYGKLILKLYIHAINGELEPGLDLGYSNKRYVSGNYNDSNIVIEPTGGIRNKTYSKFDGTPAEGITPYEARQYLIFKNNATIYLEPMEIAFNTNHGLDNGFSTPKLVLPKDSTKYFESFYQIFHIDLNKFDTSNVENMSFMFRDLGEDLEKQSSLNSWDTSNVVNMRNMFDNAHFNGDISDWDTSNVVTMRYMFRHNEILNQDFSSWDFSGLDQSTTVSIAHMVANTNMSEANIDKLVAAIIRDTSFTETEVRDVIR